MTANGYLNKKEINDVLDEAFELFNEAHKTNYSRDNVYADCFNKNNFPQVYERACTKYFKHWLQEDYTNPDFYKDTQACALVENSDLGILIRTDIKHKYEEWLEVLLHEIGHIFATANELNGDSFYEKYCHMDQAYWGYSIWKEFIADYLADLAYPYFKNNYLNFYCSQLLQWEPLIVLKNKAACKTISLLLTACFTSREYEISQSWDDFSERVQSSCLQYGKYYLPIIEHVHKKLIDEDRAVHVIDEKFIVELGTLFQEVTQNILNRVKW